MPPLTDTLARVDMVGRRRLRDPNARDGQDDGEF